MKIYEIVTIPESKKEVLSKTICDKCDKAITNNSFSDYSNDWFELDNGTYYTNADFYSVKYKMDLCLDCSLELVEQLKELGYKIQETEG